MTSNDNLHDAAELIRAAVERVPGLHLERVAEVGGRYSAVLEARPNSTYSKWVATPWHAELNELLGSVLDTLEHVEGENFVNIFSAQMFEYLCAEMLPADGRPVSLTIKEAAEKPVAGPRGEQVKVILSFRERPKKLILNKTNARVLAKALGPETDAWPGASIVLGVESVNIGKQTVPSIRVRSATAAQRAATPARQTRARPSVARAQSQIVQDEDTGELRNLVTEVLPRPAGQGDG